MTQRRIDPAKQSSGSVGTQQQQPQQQQQQALQQQHQQQQFNGALASWRAPSNGPGSTSIAAPVDTKSGAPQSGRSVSVNPLPRNESTISRPGVAPAPEPEGPDKALRPIGHQHPLLAAAGVRGAVSSQPSRHSLP